MAANANRKQAAAVGATSVKPKIMGVKGKLDLLVLTFNAAKKMIDPHVFAHHLETALVANAPTLPEVVVLSLQEVSPLSYAFIGGPLLSPFLSRYEEALSAAAIRIQSTPSTTPSTTPSPVPYDATKSNGDDVANNDGERSSEQLDANEDQQLQTPLLNPLWRRSRRTTQSPYTLVKQHNVGMTAIMLFVRHPATISGLDVAEVGFGTLDMGNKGAVAIRCNYRPPPDVGGDGQGDDGELYTQLTFVATHLAPMEWNLKRRNANWRTICSALLFGNPVALIRNKARPEDGEEVSRVLMRRGTGRVADSAASPAPTAEEEAEAEALLREAEEHDRALAVHLREALRDMTIFRPGSHVFVAGDLNYRTADESPRKGDEFPSMDPESPLHWSTFLQRDQLLKERRAGRVLQCFTEENIGFPPTYKYDILPSADGALNEAEARAAANGSAEAELVVPCQFAKHRWPSWTDRVLYMDVPEFARGGKDGQEGGHAVDDQFEVRTYQSLPLMRSSDHQPVFLRLEVPILNPTQLGRKIAKERGLAGQVLDSSRGERVVGGGGGGDNDDDEEDQDGSEQPLDTPDVRIRLPYPVDIHAPARRQAARSREFLSGWTMLLWCTKEGAAVLGSLAMLGFGSYWLYQVL